MSRRLSFALVPMLVGLGLMVIQKVREATSSHGHLHGREVSPRAVQDDDAYRRKELRERRENRILRRTVSPEGTWVAPESAYEHFETEKGPYFPDLSDAHDIAGPASETQNCVAYCLGVHFSVWDAPDFQPFNINLWGNDTARATDLFKGYGFLPQNDLDTRFEDGFQKVAIYSADTPEGKVFKHAAVQQPNGNWHSKLGKLYVIEHVTPEEIGDKQGGNYGTVVRVFRKANPAYVRTYLPLP